MFPSVPLQLHVVHYDSQSYSSLSEAAQKPQGLAVLGILIEVSIPQPLSGLSLILYSNPQASRKCTPALTPNVCVYWHIAFAGGRD